MNNLSTQVSTRIDKNNPEDGWRVKALSLSKRLDEQIQKQAISNLTSKGININLDNLDTENNRSILQQEKENILNDKPLLSVLARNAGYSVVHIPKDVFSRISNKSITFRCGSYTYQLYGDAYVFCVHPGHGNMIKQFLDGYKDNFENKFSIELTNRLKNPVIKPGIPDFEKI